MSLLKYSVKLFHPLFMKLLNKSSLTVVQRVHGLSGPGIHTSTIKYDLNEFFESKHDLESADTEGKIQTGRPWRLDELRIKSNDDLHKLWYVLLKERNMLMTTEHHFYNNYRSFPSPERMEKVEESMENIMEIVKERDDAYNLLQHGQTDDRKPRVVRNFVGLPVVEEPTEHYVPEHANPKHKLMHRKYQKWMHKHLLNYEEKMRKKDDVDFRRFTKMRKMILEKYPHLTAADCEHLKPELVWLKDYLEKAEELGDYDGRHDEAVTIK